MRGQDLLKLINDILDLAKIESGKMGVYKEPVHLDEFVAEINQKFTSVANNKGIDFAIETDEAPEQWRSDGQKLGQIIKNLLSNAIKFTSEGQVSLHIGPPTDTSWLAKTVVWSCQLVNRSDSHVLPSILCLNPPPGSTAPQFWQWY